MVHRVADHNSRYKLNDGSRMFPLLKPSSTLKIVMRALKLMGTPASDHMTWNAIRAGHATELAANGATLASILEAGEWRSAAFLSYIDANVADCAEVLRTTLQAELDEDSEVETT